MPGANPASEEVMSLQRPIPSLARPLSRLSPLTLALRWALLGLSAAGAGLLGGGLAHAQSVGQHSAATRLDDATPRSYDIPAGSLGASLGAFASQSGLLLSFDPELTRGRTAPALKGRYSVLEGLQRVLSNTGLQVAAGTSGAYLLVEPRMSGEAPADHPGRRQGPRRALHRRRLEQRRRPAAPQRQFEDRESQQRAAR